MESHDPHHLQDACRVDGLLLSYHDPLVESLLGHSVKLTFFLYLDNIMFLLLGYAPLIFGFDSVVDMDDWDYTFDDG